jgi:hypothetical protein
LPRIPNAIRRAVRDRANGRCKYCLLPDETADYPYHVEHIIARKHGGSSDLDNLAWSCIVCKGYKGSDVAGFDPKTGSLIPLYNPRLQDWDDHFEMVDGVINGKTAAARATVILLQLNNDETVDIRRALMAAGKW